MFIGKIQMLDGLVSSHCGTVIDEVKKGLMASTPG
jgi:hypothetical protein